MLQDVYKSESDTNQRNQAIGALMLAYGYIKTNWQQAVDLYTRQCSIGVNAKDLATMAATLAIGGKNPVTGKQVMDAAKVPGVLAVMATAGLYDDSGKWLYRTGLPAKSGVGGGIIAVSPGQVRDRGRVAAARRRRQQRPRAAGDRRHLERARRQPVQRKEERKLAPPLSEHGMSRLTFSAHTALSKPRLPCSSPVSPSAPSRFAWLCPRDARRRQASPAVLLLIVGLPARPQRRAAPTS